jgi:hypothetical protein
MYKIVGGDGREYGPVTGEQLRKWIAEGRISADTQVQGPGSLAWKPAAAYHDFEIAFAQAGTPSASQPFVPPPPTAKTSGLAIAALILGLVGLGCNFLTALPGLICGLLALVKIPKSGGHLKGKGLAISGICVSIVAMIVASMWMYGLYKGVRKVVKGVTGIAENMQRVNACVGEQMAAQTVKLLGGTGEVVVINMDFGPLTNSMFTGPGESFRRAIEAQPGMKLVVVESRSSEAAQMDSQSPEAFLLTLAANHTEADAIVSFVGLNLSTAQSETLDTSKLPKVLVHNLTPHGRCKELIQSGVITAGVVHRQGTDGGVFEQYDEKATCAQIFDAQYEWVSKDNIEQIAAKWQQFQQTMPQMQRTPLPGGGEDN